LCRSLFMVWFVGVNIVGEAAISRVVYSPFVVIIL
jgi:hypothetical protein